MDFQKAKTLLDNKFETYHNRGFIAKDPISVPHRFHTLQDIEIAAFFAAILAWGNRTAIINSCNRILQLMDNAPYDFIMQHQEADLKPFLNIVHRTFNGTDMLYCIAFFKHHYAENRSLETAFTNSFSPAETHTGKALACFHNYFFSLPDYPERTKKHIATPLRKSACKRLNMFLRWMVRQNSEVDFGIWKTIQSEQLISPLDTHVGDVARRLQLLTRKQNDWQAALELTATLCQFDATDPVKYDYALFGLGVEERF